MRTEFALAAHHSRAFEPALTFAPEGTLPNASETGLLGRSIYHTRGTSFAVPGVAALTYTAMNLTDPVLYSVSLGGEKRQLRAFPRRGDPWLETFSSATPIPQYLVVFGCLADRGTAPPQGAADDVSWSLESVQDEYSYARVEGWDGADARAITDEVIVQARHFFASLPPLPTPSEVSPLSDGAISFVWDLPAGYLFLAIGPRSTLHVYYDVGRAGKWERITSIDNGAARERVLAAIRALTPQEEAPFFSDRAEPVAFMLAA
jgi:hypothetical protein